MNRVTEIEQRVWSSESIEQLSLRNSDAPHRFEIIRPRCRFLIKQTIPAGQSMRTQLPLEIVDPCLISLRVICRRQQLQPDRIELQSPQTEHPLQRNGKISAAFAIFCGKTAAKENCHASRILILLACSSTNTRSLEDAAVRPDVLWHGRVRRKRQHPAPESQSRIR